MMPIAVSLGRTAMMSRDPNAGASHLREGEPLVSVELPAGIISQQEGDG